MFKVSTAFIKGQIPGVTIEQLLDLYKKELEYQSVNNISIHTSRIHFKNKLFKVVLNKFANKYSSFSAGEIKIIDTGSEYIVQMKATMKRLFAVAGFMAGFVTLFILNDSGFTLFNLLVGLIIFSLIAVIGFISTWISFPVYFTRLRNHMERELQGTYR